MACVLDLDIFLLVFPRFFIPLVFLFCDAQILRCFQTKLFLQVKIQGQNEEMLLAACEQFLGKNEDEITQVSLPGC